MTNSYIKQLSNLDVSQTMKNQITADVIKAESISQSERTYEMKKVSTKKRHDDLDFKRELYRINNDSL